MKFKEEIKVNYRIRITSENIEEVSTKAHETLPNNKVGDLAFTLYGYLGVCSVLNKPYYLRKEKFLDGIEYKDEEYDEENGCLKDGVEFTEEELDEALMMLDKYKLIEIVSDEEVIFGGR